MLLLPYLVESFNPLTGEKGGGGGVGRRRADTHAHTHTQCGEIAAEIQGCKLTVATHK